jgi:uncharacterized protein (DUF1501 family)
LSARARAAAAETPVKETSIILLFLTGGPSQIETFDPKMTAPREYRSVTGDVASNIPGVALGGTFSRLARHADKLALVRSFSHDVSDHTKAVEQVMRGGNTIHHAGMGAFAARLRGTSRPGTGLPTHVYLSAREVDRQFEKERQRLLEATGPGELGGANAPFPVGGDGQLNRDMQLGIARARLDDRMALHRALDRLNRQVDARGAMRQLDQFEEQALELVLGKSRTAFDLSNEDPRLVEAYDTGSYLTGITQDRPSTLGRQLLLARRLCEAGCGFVTIHNPGWDMHGGKTQMNIPEGMRRLGTPVDHAVSAFLEDVADRGLSDKILLIITGEFGRSPRVSDNGGRDHWPRLSTLAFAGGGLRMGQVIGRSTAKAEEPQSDPITLDSLFATVMHVLFDVPALSAEASQPRDIASLLSRSRPIAELI